MAETPVATRARVGSTRAWTVRAGAENGPREVVARGVDAVCEADERCVRPRKTGGRLRKSVADGRVRWWNGDGTRGNGWNPHRRGSTRPISPARIRPTGIDATRVKGSGATPSHADASHRFFSVGRMSKASRVGSAPGQAWQVPLVGWLAKVYRAEFDASSI